MKESHEKPPEVKQDWADTLRAQGVNVTIAPTCYGIEESQRRPAIRSKTNRANGAFFGPDHPDQWKTVRNGMTRKEYRLNLTKNLRHKKNRMKARRRANAILRTSHGKGRGTAPPSVPRAVAGPKDRTNPL